MVQSLLKPAKLDWPVPDFSTVSRRPRHLRVQLSYRPCGSPLHLLIDSTGIKFLGEGEWKRKKHGAEYRRQWRKVHLGIEGPKRSCAGLQTAGAANMEDVERLPSAQPGVETKMHCFKRLGERVMARTFERQLVELHVRVALLNRFSQLGLPVTLAMA